MIEMQVMNVNSFCPSRGALSGWCVSHSEEGGG